MIFNHQQIKAVIFDLGNTLIEFTASQVQVLDRAIAGAMERVLGPFDIERFYDLRRRAYRSPYFDPQLRETTISRHLGELVRELHGREAEARELEPIIEVHDEAFVSAIEAPEYLHDFLAALRRRYKIGLASNYPCGRSIRASLDRSGIARHLDAVVVSGDVGHVKPHPLPFRRALEALGVESHEAVFVGDNWLGDIQGAKRLGMRAVHTVQFDTLEVFDRQEGDHDADLRIEHLTDLGRYL